MCIAVFIIQCVSYPAPSPPAGLTAAQYGLASARVSWTAPAQPPNVTGYTIHYMLEEGGEEGTATTGPSNTSTVISGLTAGASYSFTVVALSDTFSSNMSGPVTVTIGTH